MDLKEQLKKAFPEHVPPPEEVADTEGGLRLQTEPILCKYEKRKGKPLTLIEGYSGPEEDFRKFAKELKTRLNTGGSYKNGQILIQGDFRDEIMQLLKGKGFVTKRIGG